MSHNMLGGAFNRPEKLRRAVCRIADGQPDRRAVDAIVLHSHRIAVAYLRQKSYRGQLQADFFGLTLEDLALDCIADIFQQDDRGQLPVVQNYFNAVQWHEMDEPDVHMALRRLVFTKVNEGLFRRYKEADPTLAKIIRNIKAVAKSSSELRLSRRDQDLWLVTDIDPGSTNGVSARPLLPIEIVETHLVSFVRRAAGMEEVVSFFRGLLLEMYPTYYPGYPLMPFAKAVRNAVGRLVEHTDDQESASPIPLDELYRAIDSVIGEIRLQLEHSYVTNGKLSRQTFDGYMKAIRELLAAQYSSRATRVESHYDAFSNNFGGISKEEYRQYHRNTFEYLVKLSRQKLLKVLNGLYSEN